MLYILYPPMELHPAQIQVQIPHKEKQPRYKSYAKILAIAINLGLSNFYFGYSLVYISTMPFKQIMKIFSITLGADAAKGILTGCIPIGAGIGALLGTKLIHVFSRRKYVLLINIVAITVGCLIYINNFIILLIMRIIQGICVGMYTSIIPLYTTQISPVEIQSSTAPFTQIFCSSGTTIAYLFYFILSTAIKGQAQQQLIWYLILAFPLIPLVIQTLVLLFIFPYETPKYYLLHHQKKKTKALLAQLYKPEYVETVYHEKIQDIQFNKTKQAAIAMSRQLSGMPAPTIRLASKASMSSGGLSGVEMDQPITPGVAIFCAIHCMILRQFSGINAVVAYGGDIISQANPDLRSIVPCFLNFEVMIGAVAAIWLLHKVGKRTLLQIGTVILALSLLLITIGFFMLNALHDVAFILILLGLIVFTFTFGITYGAIIWAYVSEIVEPSYTIIATMVTWIFASIVIILFPILKTSVLNGSPSILFLFFCAWMTVSFFVNQKVLVETKDKTEHQIRVQYMGISCNPCSCLKKQPDYVARAASMTQSQLFDLNSINLKLAELKRQKQRQKELGLLKQSHQRMIKSYDEMDITIRKNEKETKHSLSSSTQPKKQECQQTQFQRPSLERQMRPPNLKQNHSTQIQTTFDQLNESRFNQE